MTTEKTESMNPFSAFQAFSEYLTDAAQRTVLYWDIMRQRGNQFQEHMAKEVPHVLQFEMESIMDGRTLPEPVNYGIVKIRSPKETKFDERKRPFVVFDPRAGHGPGIGGFKADSEIGMAMKAGHPCYFVGFSPNPEPGQTIEKVIEAWAVFMRKVIELHPKAEGKPVVIGNCQAGWALMMMASKHPELCGPIIVAGSPLSYWGGVRGIYPMRYTGGMLGGSWLTALTSDIGNGKFDGALLVQNMENLNPANTLWTKQYNVYANVDTEGPRYLGFERWWGGHVLLTAEEMQFIVDNLFVGNKLSTAGVVTSDGVRLDFRKISSPIVCLCSKGDNITPPQQALGWILDLYQNDADIIAAGQTIIYVVHEDIGHLGIFVAGSVAKKEHREFASNIDLIDCLPPGLYEAVMTKKTAETSHAELVTGDYISSFERRSLDDLRALGGNTVEDERCFAAVANLSEINLGLYRTMMQPFVRALANEQSASWLRRMHPLRMQYEMFSDNNPVMKPVAPAAEEVKKNRKPVSPDNPFLQWEKNFSEWMTSSLKAFGEWRDMMTETMFFAIYGQPWVQALLGQRSSEQSPRKHPGQSAEHSASVQHRIEELRAKMDQGGPREAAVRALIYVRIPENAVDERGMEMLNRVRAEIGAQLALPDFKQAFRDQYLMVTMDERRAIEAIPILLKGHEAEAKQMLDHLIRILDASGPLGQEAQKRLAEVKHLFGAKDPQGKTA